MFHIIKLHGVETLKVNEILNFFFFENDFTFCLHRTLGLEKTILNDKHDLPLKLKSNEFLTTRDNFWAGIREQWRGN